MCTEDAMSSYSWYSNTFLASIDEISQKIFLFLQSVFKWTLQKSNSLAIIGFHVTSSYSKIKITFQFHQIKGPIGPWCFTTFCVAQQGSSFCNRARLNFQAFTLRDMKIAAQEGRRVDQKRSYRFSLC